MTMKLAPFEASQSPLSNATTATQTLPLTAAYRLNVDTRHSSQFFLKKNSHPIYIDHNSLNTHAMTMKLAPK
jgi:hypothetical protein